MESFGLWFGIISGVIGVAASIQQFGWEKPLKISALVIALCCGLLGIIYIGTELFQKTAASAAQESRALGDGTKTGDGKPRPEPSARSGKESLRPDDGFHRVEPGDEPNQPVEIVNSLGMRFVRLDAGKFRMGSRKSDVERWPSEEPPREVELSQPFCLGKFPVTQDQYRSVTGANPSCFSADGKGNEPVAGLDTNDFPVDSVSWVEAMAFCRQLSNLPVEKAAGRKYTLPTEAQREYACRASAKTAFSFGDDAKQLGAHCWFADNSEQMTHPVGKKKPNAWGFHDMHGLVWEWCSDWYDKDSYKEGNRKNPAGPDTGLYRVLRGGSWCSEPRDCRSASRFRLKPDDHLYNVGFRVVLTID